MQTDLWACLWMSTWSGVTEMERPTLTVGDAIPCTEVLDCTKREKPAGNQHSSVSTPWLWMQCDWLLHDLANMTSASWWTVTLQTLSHSDPTFTMLQVPCQSSEKRNWCKPWKPPHRFQRWSSRVEEGTDLTVSLRNPAPRSWREHQKHAVRHAAWFCYPCLRLCVNAATNLIHFLRSVPVWDVSVIENWEVSCLTTVSILSNS